MKKTILLVATLTMVLAATVPGLAQDGEFDVTPAEEPVATCALGPPDRVPGEFLVTYYSEEEMWAAPQENVIRTTDNSGWYYPDEGIVYYPIPSYTQTLHFEDIASIPDPCERFAAEEAKRQEILTWPSVKYAEYNGFAIIDDPVGPSE